jgi:hypothetical protein
MQYFILSVSKYSKLIDSHANGTSTQDALFALYLFPFQIQSCLVSAAIASLYGFTSTLVFFNTT